jgi:hypothetical protein
MILDRLAKSGMVSGVVLFISVRILFNVASSTPTTQFIGTFGYFLSISLIAASAVAVAVQRFRRGKNRTRRSQ